MEQLIPYGLKDWGAITLRNTLIEVKAAQRYVMLEIVECTGLAGR